MAAGGQNLPMIWKIHNATCPAYKLNIGFLKPLCIGCREMTKREAGS